MAVVVVAILVPAALTFSLIAVFMVLERALRTDASAKTLEPTARDRETTRLVGAAFGASWFVLALSVPANFWHIGRMEPGIPLNVIGLLLMALGITLRVAAARTLGRSYSRTLMVREEHRVVSEGIYRRIRHPGYLGVIILFLGAGLSTSNWIALAVIAIMMIPAYLRRMSVEEGMLAESLGSAYVEYMKRTRRLIPFIY
jgi:protein-S-isoprenylcysteine O-methyltransferase Ste14